MDERVKEFLEKKQQEAETRKEKKKAKTLISLGLYEKVYSPDGNYSIEYHLSEWDKKGQKSKYYKKVPIAVSEKEFEEIRKFSNEKVAETNPVVIGLTVIAWIIFIGGFIAGIALGTTEVTKGFYYTYTDTEFSFATAITYWAISLISGMMMLGFAEVVKSLNDIKNANNRLL